MVAFLGLLVLGGPAWGQEGGWPDLMQAGPKVGGGEQDAAVVVGIEDYVFVADVPGAVDNALAWSRWLSRDRGVPLSRITVLTNADGTKERVGEALAKAGGQVGAGGQLWFVFIGHGAASPDGKDGMLVGADVQQTATSIYARSVSREEVLGTVKRLRVSNTVLVLDTCFSGRGSGNEALASGLQPLIAVKGASRPSSGVTVFTAGRGDQFAGPLPGSSRPAFSYLLLGALRGWGDKNSDGAVSEQEAVDYVSENLSFLLAGSRAQTPELWSPNQDRALVRGRKLESGPDVFALATALRKGGGSSVGGSSGGGSVAVEERVDWGGGSGASSVVEFISEPAGASVLVDGKLLCQTTPCSKALGRGVHRVELAGDCFVPFTSSVEVGARSGKVSATLKARPSGVEVSAQDDKGNDLVAEVWVDRVRLGTTPGRFEVGVCSRKLEVKKSGHKGFSGALELKPGAVQRVTATLRSQAGGGATADMVRVRAGTFTRGSTALANEQPVGQVVVSGFWIDRTEVTVDAYAACVKAGGRTPPSTTTRRCSGAYSKWNNWGKGDRGSHPVNCVDWNQSDTYCRWLGKRLPTEGEWEKAARGTDGRTYPWGEATPSCAYAVMNEGGLGCGEYRTWAVGSKPAGASPYGALDMSGNVWEWVSDWYSADAYAGAASMRDPQGPVSGSSRVYRGGGFYFDAGLLRAANRYGLAPAIAYYNLGFRCARSMP